MAPARRRILFVSENVTLAQVVRLASLAQRLDPTRYEVHFACADFDAHIFERARLHCWVLPSAPREQCLRRAEQGRRIYDTAILRDYVERELVVFAAVQPELVVGDFRLSLSVSAPLAGVPCATLINAYWSPYAVRDGFPMPDHPLVRLVGVERASRLFPLACRYAFARFAAPINALRRRYELPAIGGLPEVLCHGDYTLYPDVPELCPTRELPQSHHFLGPVLWAPEVELPPPVAELIEGTKPFVYVTLGSSGRVAVLGAVLQALAQLRLTALVATAGRLTPAELARLPSNGYVTDFVPGHLAARAAKFVITNGGSSTGYQALAEGRPVLGIPANLDQYLATAAIDRAGAGVSVRAGSLTATQVMTAASELLSRPLFHERARELSRALSRLDCHERFEHFLSSGLERRHDHARAS